MTNYSLRARMMILILAPTVLIGLLLSIFFVAHRYNDLQRQLEDAGASIIEPLAVSSEYGMNFAKPRIHRPADQRPASASFGDRAGHLGV
ncbi:BarA sensory histidine kinase [Klebsiella variicola]|uniref:BarA sensory histidine kinase n=1 Tax=Klebsiella variicola TaxID=244366 RepID=A0A7H4MRC9_KLEVA|nr:BarA sensory histidine kinase [Klebsiella variicola]